MTFFDAVILGILQGLTEFLPVSSSGHLVLAQALLGVSDYGVSFEVIVHLGTVLSVLVFFRATLIRLIQSLFRPAMVEERKLIVFLVIGTIPAGVIGVLFENFFEQTFSEPLLTSFFLLVTGAILVVSRFFKNGVKPVGAGSSLIMGFGQALAIFPGISRSGSTIVAGMMAGVEPAKAAEFSFLLVIPAILGATVLKIRSLAQLDAAMAGHYIVGAACAFITGLIAVYTVLAVIRRGRFEYFGYYCFAAGLVGLYLFW